MVSAAAKSDRVRGICESPAPLGLFAGNPIYSTITKTLAATDSSAPAFATIS